MLKTLKQNTGKVGGVAGALALAIPLVMAWEGKVNDPYDDVVKVRTVCYGETQGIQERHYSDAECTAMLGKSILKHAEPIVKCVPQISEKPYQLAASISLAYNIGTSAYCKSSAAAQFRLGNDAAGCAAFSKWTYAKGRYIQGLANRRAYERSLCEKGLS